MLSRAEVVLCARSYVGTPFHHQGRLKGIGVDCVGLPACVAKELGIPHEDFTVYPRRPNGSTLRELIEISMEPIDLHDVGLGDLIVFRIVTHPCHVAFRTDYGILHAYSGVGKVVEHVYSDNWKRRAVSGYRYRGVQWLQ